MKIVLIDDHEIFRLGLRSLLESDPDIEIVGEAGNADDGLALMARVSAELVILDYAMPGSSGLELLGRIKRKYPELKLILLTANRSESILNEALSSGANGVVLKQDTSDQLLDAVNAVFAGNSFVSVSIVPLVERQDALSELTKREHQVLRMIANGYRNREISEELNISMKTVDTHRTNLMRKLNLHSLVDLVEFANNAGILDTSI